jgi:hypothetical protein
LIWLIASRIASACSCVAQIDQRLFALVDLRHELPDPRLLSFPDLDDPVEVGFFVALARWSSR